MWGRLKLKTKSAAAPVSFADLKSHCRVDGDAENGLLQLYLDAAISRIDGPSGIGRCMVTQSWVLSLDEFPSGGAVNLALGPVSSVTSVTYRDADGAMQTVSPVDYVLDATEWEAWVKPAYGKSWPSVQKTAGAVLIEFVAGSDPGEVPALLKAAVLLLAGHFYANREAVNVGNIVTEMPLGVSDILESYRVGRVA